MEYYYFLGSFSKFISFTIVFLFLLSCFGIFTSTEAQGVQHHLNANGNGNITIKWDVISWTPDGYVAVANIYNFQPSRRIRAPGWSLGWTWAKKEVIWSMVGAQTTDQGDCSRFKGNIPHSCKKEPSVVDLLPGVPYNQQIANCCRGGVIKPNGLSSFQITVGIAGTTNKTVKLPQNFTFKAPGRPAYACGPAKVGKPTRFTTPDGRRFTQALMTWNIICKCSKGCL